MKYRHGWLAGAALALTLMCALPLRAQRVSSSAAGVVTDPSGGVIAGAEVTVTDLETGDERTARTGDSGQYRVFGLNPGMYRISAAHAGFETVVRQGIALLVSQEAEVSFTLPVGEMRESVAVNSDASLLDMMNSGMSGVVTEHRLRELPLNGRDVFQLTLLQAGVLPIAAAGGNPFADGGSSRATVQGARPTMNNITLDGADINDPAFNSPPGGAAGIQLGVDAIREFRVLLNNYGAEFGRNAGANVQFVTRSGGNELHGSLFEFHRNAALDARNFFDLGGVPPFVRNQFGGSLGGPIRRNRTFFFVNMENLLESQSITQSLSVPDANAHQGLLPSATSPGSLVNVGVSSEVAPFLNLYPLPNAGSLGGGLGTLRVSSRQPTRENYGLVRLDHSFSPGSNFLARYVIDDSASTVPFGSTSVPGFPSERAILNQYAMLGWQHTIHPSLLNDLRLNFTRIEMNSDPSFSYPLSISLTPGAALGAVSVAGIPQLGGNVILPIGSASNTWEIIDNVFYQHGGHTLKTGVDWKHFQMNGRFDALVNGEYIFNDLSQFGLLPASTNPSLEFFLRATPFLYLGVDPALADSNRGFRQSYTGAYLQDDWKVGPRLTLNLGLRWEYSSNPGEAHGRLANIRNLLTDTQTTPGSVWDSVPMDLWSPRFGFAWQPVPGGKTVVRGGFGLMRDQMWANLYSDTRFYEPFYRALQYLLPNFLNHPPSVDSLIGYGGPPSVIGIFGVTYRPDFPYYLQYSLNVQRELSRDWMIFAAYVGSRGNHLPRTGEANPFLPAIGRRINPSFGSSEVVVTDAQSFYNSGQFGIEKRFSAGLSAQVNYTLSKSIDDMSGAFPADYVSESGISQNFFDRKGDRARSTFDRTHALVANFLYSIPRGDGPLFGGWGIGGVVTLLSGPPFTANLGSFNNSVTLSSSPADRPDLRPGVSPCSTVPGSANMWFDPSIFTLPPPGTFGNAGRNILCGPGLATFDFSVTKQTRITERTELQFRAEFFNLFNHANFDVPVNTQGPSGAGGNGDAVFVGSRGPGCNPATDPFGCGIPAANAGQIFRTVTSSRQIQFGLKLVF
jgi:hypothetical protein